MISGIVRHYRTYLCTPVVTILSLTGILAATLTGPFGTHTIMTIGERFVFWTLSIAISMVIARGIGPLIELKFKKSPVIVREGLICGLFTLVFGPILVGLVRYLGMGNGAVATPGVATLFVWTFMVAVCIAIARQTVRLWAINLKGQHPIPKLYDRLPEGVDAPITTLSADGHHTLISTRAEDYRVRLRIADAIAEMEGTAGVVVHRSHWVNKDAVTGIERDEKGKMRVLLTCGRALPVSKKRERDLEDLLAI